MKQINASEAELTALMDDLEAMLADSAAPPVTAQVSAPEPEVVAEPQPIIGLPVVALAVEITPTEVVPAAAEPEPEPVAVEAEPVEVTKPVAEPEAQIAVTQVRSTEAVEKLTQVEVQPQPQARPSSLQFFVDPNLFRQDAAISFDNLDEAMMQQTGLRAYYGTQAAYAEAQQSRAKANLERIEALLYEEHRKLMLATGEKATDKAVDAAVKCDARWFKAKNMLIEAQTIADVNKHYSFSMNDRRDMLIQLGSDRREEMKGQLRIVEKSSDRESLAERARQVGMAKPASSN